MANQYKNRNLRQNVNFRLTPELAERLEAQISRHRRLRSEIVRTAIEHYLLILESLPVKREGVSK